MMKSTSFILLALLFIGCASGPQKFDKIANVKKYKEKTILVMTSELNKTFTTKCPKRYKKIYDKKPWRYLQELGNSCVQKRNWRMTKRIAKQIFKAEPYSPWGPYYLSLEAEAQGSYYKSLWMVDLAMKKMPYGLFHYQKARILWKQKYYSLAEVELLTAVAMDTKVFGAHEMLGQLYLRDLEYKKSIEHFDLIVDRPSYKKTALRGLSISYFYLSDYKKSYNFTERFLEYSPYDYQAHLRMAHISETVNKDLKSALRSYKKIQYYQKTKKIQGRVDVDVSLKISELKKTIDEKEQKRSVSSSKKKSEVVR